MTEIAGSTTIQENNQLINISCNSNFKMNSKELNNFLFPLFGHDIIQEHHNELQNVVSLVIFNIIDRGVPKGWFWGFKPPPN